MVLKKVWFVEEVPVVLDGGNVAVYLVQQQSGGGCVLSNSHSAVVSSLLDLAIVINSHDFGLVPTASNLGHLALVLGARHRSIGWYFIRLHSLIGVDWLSAVLDLHSSSCEVFGIVYFSELDEFLNEVLVSRDAGVEVLSDIRRSSLVCLIEIVSCSVGVRTACVVLPDGVGGE